MRRVRIITISVLVLILLGWGFLLYKYLEIKNQENFHGTIYDKEAQNFTLTSHNGNRVSLSQFRGKVVPVFFGYTHCPDICPTTLSVLKNVMGELGKLENKVQVLFITIDPQRDTVQRLKGYVPYFHKSFLGLTGTSQEIDKVAKSYNASYFKEDTNSKAGYFMTHTSSVYLIDPEGDLFLKYPPNELNSKWIAEDIRKILE